MKTYEKGTVISSVEIAPLIYDMRVKTPMADRSVPGQFVMIYPECRSTLLPRPISICEGGNGELRFVYRVAGKGTAEFSTLKAGDELRLLGTLGNGYDISLFKGKKVFLMGGGIGVPPMLELFKKLTSEGIDASVVLGYRDGNLFLKDDFEKYGPVYIATEDGSVGTRGNVLDAVRENGLEPDAICACGPMPMLRAIKNYAAAKSIPAYISLEERMACGVGACLGCVCKTTHKDGHSHVNNARVCTEGPVFEAGEVEI